MDELLLVRTKNNVPMRLHNMDQSTYNDPRPTCCTAPWGPTVEEEMNLVCTYYAFLTELPNDSSAQPPVLVNPLTWGGV